MSKIRKLLQYAALAKAQTGKSYPAQLMEIQRLRRHGRGLGAQEYYELEIFNDRMYPGQRKDDCIGWRVSSDIDRRLNHMYWRAVANDKLLNYALLQHYGFPIPETVAIFSPTGRRIGSETGLRNAGDVKNFLASSTDYPLFIKPISAGYGHGTYRLAGFDAEASMMIDTQGRRIPFAELMDNCMNPRYSGMLFQKCLQPHPKVEAMIGRTTSCVRVVIVLNRGVPKVHMTTWKIGCANNINDNFCMGSTGNLTCWLKKENGEIENVISGLWPNGGRVSHHPDTGALLDGQTLPDWQDAMALCLAASIHLPGLRLQNWDVAFCAQGPVLMELNTESDVSVMQYLGHTPFIDASIREAMG